MNQAIHQVERKTSRTGDRHELGRRVAELLAGAWRESDECLPTLSEAELTEIVPVLCESGAGALAWWRIRNTPLRDTAAGDQLHEVYRRHRLSALIHEREIAYVLSLLRAEGIEPVLVKGWAIARLYPDAGLRPYGDIDLCIRPDQFAQASAALKCLADIDGHYVDLHSGFGKVGRSRAGSPRGQPAWGARRQEAAKQKLARRDWDELFARSQLVPLAKSKVLSEPGAVATGSQAKSKVQSPKSKVQSEPVPPGFVRVLCDEDHLRLLSLHLLRSGARRPPWLCDIALLLESLNSASRAKDFRWDVCLGQGLDRNINQNLNWRNLNWIAMTIGLAHHLLGADVGGIENTTLAERAGNLPRWLKPAVLRQWSGRRVQTPTSNVQGHVSAHRLWTLDFGLWARLDNPVRATAAVGGQFNNWPRLPYRVAELVTRIPEIPEQLISLVEQFAVRQSASEVRSASRAGAARWSANLRLTEE